MDELSCGLVFVNPIHRPGPTDSKWKIGLLVKQGNCTSIYVQVNKTESGIHRYDLVDTPEYLREFSEEFKKGMKTYLTGKLEYVMPCVLDDIKNTAFRGDILTAKDRLTRIISDVVFCNIDKKHTPANEFQIPGNRQRITQLQYACMCFGYVAASCILGSGDNFKHQLSFIADDIYPRKGIYAELYFESGLGTPYPVDLNITWELREPDKSLVDCWALGKFNIIDYIDVWDFFTVWRQTSFSNDTGYLSSIRLTSMIEDVDPGIMLLTDVNSLAAKCKEAQGVDIDIEMNDCPV